MNKAYIIILVLILLIGALFFVFNSKKSEAPAPIYQIPNTDTSGVLPVPSQE